MNEDRRPPSDPPAGADPLLRPADPPRGSSSGPKPSGRRRHAARGARAVALVTSVAATGLIAGAMAYAERSDEADGEPGETTTGSTAAGAATAADTLASNTGAATTAAPSETIDSPTSSAATTSIDGTTTTEATSTTDATTSTVASGGGFADGAWVGSAEYTEWGDVQVQVTISGGEIVDIESLQIPSDRKSSRINDGAVPVLEAQAIAIQGAELDIVSGATYTSRTYAASLQSALDEAAMAPQQAAG